MKSKHLKQVFHVLLSHSTARRCLEAIPAINRKLRPWQRTHPFDRYYGIDTSGFVPAEELVSDRRLHSQISAYAGSQPTIIRTALSALGKIDEYNFVDLGCGKGRAMVIAGEFPFLSLLGVEISGRLAKIARRNVAAVQLRNLRSTSFTIVEANAAHPPLPPGKVVLFFYNSFGHQLLTELIRTLENHIASVREHLFFVYYNPVHGALLDASPAFERWYSNTLPYAKSELGFGPDTEDTVVIWQSVKEGLITPHTSSNRQIITTSQWRAELVKP